MIIKKIEIQNFRALRNISIECDNILAMVGKNGAGKSSIMYALEKFYDPGAQFTEYDYFNRDTSQKINIRVTYGDLTDEETSEFSSYVDSMQLVVSKEVTIGGAKYYGVRKQIREFSIIRGMAGAKDRKDEFNKLIDEKRFSDLNNKAKSSADADVLMSEYESAHADEMEPMQEQTQFFGPKNVGGGKLDKYTKFVLIPAVRDASTELTGKGAIFQLIDILVMRSVNKREDVRNLHADFEKRIKEVYNSDNLTELNDLGAIITELLEMYSPGAALELSFGDVILPKIATPSTLASLLEDNYSCPISYTGHGLQRALIFALLHKLSITSDRTIDPTEENSEAIIPTSIKNPDLILAIEEPELYLHPSRSRYLSDILLRLVEKNPDSSDSKVQIIYGTHSPYFVDMHRFDQIRIARKISSEDHDIRETAFSSFSRADAVNAMSALNPGILTKITEASFVSRSMPIMTSLVNEGFFADVVVVVEGASDVAALWSIQEILLANWDKNGISIVSANGKNNIDRPVLIFRGLNIPTYFVFDADSNKTGDAKVASDKTNAILLRLANKAETSVDKTFVNSNCAAYGVDLENEIKDALGAEHYDAIRSEIATELEYTEPSKVLKNYDGMRSFVDAVYKRGMKIPVLEEIVTNISKLKN